MTATSSYRKTKWTTSKTIVMRSLIATTRRKLAKTGTSKSWARKQKTDGLVKVEASGTMDLKADAPLSIQSSATAEMKSPATTVKGDGSLTLKGGMVMIN